MKSLILCVFAVVLTHQAQAGVISHEVTPGISHGTTLQGPSTKTTITGPDGSVINAEAPGGVVSTSIDPGFTLEGSLGSAPEIALPAFQHEEVESRGADAKNADDEAVVVEAFPSLESNRQDGEVKAPSEEVATQQDVQGIATQGVVVAPQEETFVEHQETLVEPQAVVAPVVQGVVGGKTSVVSTSLHQVHPSPAVSAVGLVRTGPVVAAAILAQPAPVVAYSAHVAPSVPLVATYRAHTAFVATPVTRSGYPLFAPGSGLEGQYVDDHVEKLYDDGSYKGEFYQNFH